MLLPRPGKPKKLLDQRRDLMPLKHYGLRTERTYCDWVERFIRFHGLRHPRDLGEAEVTEFLTDLARRGRVAAATQQQALSALLFLYHQVLKVPIGWRGTAERAKQTVRGPGVVTTWDVHTVVPIVSGGAVVGVRGWGELTALLGGPSLATLRVCPLPLAVNPAPKIALSALATPVAPPLKSTPTTRVPAAST